MLISRFGWEYLASVHPFGTWDLVSTVQFVCQSVSTHALILGASLIGRYVKQQTILYDPSLLQNTSIWNSVIIQLHITRTFWGQVICVLIAIDSFCFQGYGYSSSNACWYMPLLGGGSLSGTTIDRYLLLNSCRIRPTRSSWSTARLKTVKEFLN